MFPLADGMLWLALILPESVGPSPHRGSGPTSPGRHWPLTIRRADRCAPWTSPSARHYGRFGNARRRPLQGQQLLPVDGHVARRLDAEADLTAVDVHDRDADVLPDINLLAEFSAEHQHIASLLRANQGCESC